MTTSKRVLYSDVKPYALPDRLEDLRGPEHGVMELPLNVYWGPNPVVDVDTDDGIEKAYQSVIQEGRIEDLVAIVNPERLRVVWSALLLPGRARSAWESRFPALTA
ncbi:transcriptional regulator [Curtobacterium sp. VKM Ac-2865]|uniref:transcriptional regulator n=1 Tax=Curtobacterium sp. VKM Ac-2865 TaxID=2783817 RepID=UPI00188AE778|nr:transcriptional regulator [Curtobacterium sp. VKM Ac-2865]MBF4582425.1 transcriptional regulator [Curtobacterium sp. VKM Ac-2865]